MNEETLLTFPCAFPIHLIARSGDEAIHPDEAHCSVHIQPPPARPGLDRHDPDG